MFNHSLNKLSISKIDEMWNQRYKGLFPDRISESCSNGGVRRKDQTVE
jgi:hypothetical protein